MLMSIKIIIGIIAVYVFIITCYVIHKINLLSDKVNHLDACAITYFSAPSCQYDRAVHELNELKKALRQQGIATNYVLEEKLDYSGCKESKEVNNGTV